MSQRVVDVSAELRLALEQTRAANRAELRDQNRFGALRREATQVNQRVAPMPEADGEWDEL